MSDDQNKWKSVDELLGDLCSVKGTSEGVRLYQTIMPGIIGDFANMLDKAGTGETVSEEYRLEDMSGKIGMEGERLPNGEIKLRARYVSAQ